MIKYWPMFTIALAEFFAYRLNFILWRVRVVISILITYFLWQSVFRTQDVVLGYSQSRMLTYIMLITFINGVVLSTQTHKVAAEISLGNLSNFLLKPMNIFSFNIARDLADKTVNTVFSIVEIALLLIFLKPPIVIQTNIIWLIIFIGAVICAAALFFVINLILSFIGFWSYDTWAPRFIFYILITFLAGMYFPLDIFPSTVFNILKLLPFAYIVFFPIKIYLGEFTALETIYGFVLIIFWLTFLYLFMIYIWRKGLRIYTAWGR